MTDSNEPRRPGPDGPEVFVRPAPERLVPRTDGKPWSDIAGIVHGDWITEDQYVRRRLADADLVFGDPAAAEKAEKLAKAEAEKAQAKADAEAEAARSAESAAKADATRKVK